MTCNERYESLPIVGAQLVKLRFCGDAKESGVAIETAERGTAVIRLRDAKLDLCLSGAVSITTKARDDTAVIWDIAPAREQCIRIEEAAIAFSGSSDEWREILRSYERTGTLARAVALRLNLVAVESVDLEEHPDPPLHASNIDDPYRVTPPSSGSPWHIDPETGYFGFLSPPGTSPVTSEDVKRLLEDFPLICERANRGHAL